MCRYLIAFILVLIIGSCSSDNSKNSIYALLISKDNEVVKETYFNGKTKTDKLNVQSITKSIVSLLIGIAIDKGYIKDEQVPVHDFFPDSPYFNSTEKKQITIKHLLNHTSGLEWKGYLEHEGFMKSDDPSQYVLDRELAAQPGETYNYHSGGTHLLSVILTKATGKSTLAFAEEHLFNPLDCNSVIWEKRNGGYYDGAGFGLSMLASDLVKIGDLMLNGGKHNNVQLIPSNWIEKSFNEGLKSKTKWGLRKSKHGYGWYSKMNGDEQILYAMGYGGQFIFIIPTKDLVVVANHNHDTPDGIGQQVDFLKESFSEVLKQ